MNSRESRTKGLFIYLTMNTKWVFALLIGWVCTAYASCVDSVYGSAEEGEVVYAACEDEYDGYISAICTSGTFIPANTSTCVLRSVSLFTYGYSSLTFTVGKEISTLTLISDFSFSSFDVDPSLPEGLTLDPSTGSISGTPTAASSSTDYVISGHGIAEAQVTLTLAVEELMCPAVDSFPATASGLTASSTTACPVGYQGTAKRLCTDGVFGDLDTTECTPLPPSSLSYSPSSIYTVKRLDSVIMTPFYSNEAVSFSVSPQLPTGLSMTPMGTILGIPTVLQSSQQYTVTATGHGGAQTQATITLTVQEAACTGLKDQYGSSSSISHGSTIMYPCQEGYGGSWGYLCQDGVYTSQVDNCVPDAPEFIKYSQSSFVLFTNEKMVSDEPMVKGVAGFFSASSLPDGFSIDSATGVISGNSSVVVSSTVVTVTGKATESSINSKTTTVIIQVVTPYCEKMEDYVQKEVEQAASYKCPDGYQEGTMKRTCTLTKDNEAVWSLPTEYCQKNQDYTFIMIAGIIFVVCLLVLIIGAIIHCSRNRAQSAPKLKSSTTTAKPTTAKVAPQSTATPPKVVV